MHPKRTTHPNVVSRSHRGAARLRAASLLALVGAVTCAPALAAERCEPAALIAAAERAQGGPIRALQLSGAGTDFVVGQGWHPRGPWPKFNVERYERTVDFAASASSLITVRSQALHPPRGGARQPFERTEQVTAVAPGSTRGATLRRELALLLPAGFIDAATRSQQVSASTLGRGCALTVVVEEGAPITAELAADGEIRRLTSKIADDVLGDAAVETRFSGRMPAGQWNLPARIVQQIGGYPVLDLRVTHAEVGEQARVSADLAAPLADWMAPARMPSEPLGEGIFVIPGRYSALAIDLGDHIVLIEAPQSEARAVEVIAEARRLIPGKPIRYVVNTHAHFDHAAGLRTAVAEGATIVTHRSNVSFLREALNRPRTLRPDALSRTPTRDRVPAGGRAAVPRRAQAVRSSCTVSKAWTTSTGCSSPTCRRRKCWWRPTPSLRRRSARTVPPAAINPYNVQLLDNVERLGLDVERLISIHYAADGRRVGMDELRLAAGRAGASLGASNAEHRP